MLKKMFQRIATKFLSKFDSDFLLENLLEDPATEKLLAQKLLKNYSLEKFLTFDKLGIHILPKHFYSPVPDYDWLENNKTVWMGRSSLSGIYWDLDDQLSWLKQVCHDYYHEVAGLKLFQEVTTSGLGRGFGEIESQVLHCAIRQIAPQRILEIGGGVTTACMLKAVEFNAQEGKVKADITCIEPYPLDAFKDLQGINHIEELCQIVPESVFAKLEPGDLLSIDSSHAVKVGSELSKIYTEIIPNLPANVFIHIHDIRLPYLYGRRMRPRFDSSQETLLLLALLINNERLSILSCLSGLHYDRPEALKEVILDYRPQANEEGLRKFNQDSGHFPSSIWLQTK